MTTDKAYEYCRRELGWTHAQAAEVLRVDIGTSIRWEGGKRTCPHTVLVLLALLLDGRITLDDIDGVWSILARKRLVKKSKERA